MHAFTSYFVFGTHEESELKSDSLAISCTCVAKEARTDSFDHVHIDLGLISEHEDHQRAFALFRTAPRSNAKGNTLLMADRVIRVLGLLECQGSGLSAAPSL